MLTVYTEWRVKVKKYFVLSRPQKDAEPIIETMRTDKTAAEKDVNIFKEICQKYTWIEESN